MQTNNMYISGRRHFISRENWYLQKNIDDYQQMR